MNVNEWLQVSTKLLETNGVSTGRLDCLVLLEDTLSTNRARLLAEPDTQLSSDQKVKLKKLLNRRAAHEPLAYIREHTEFYGRDFVITPDVLEPRPESEAIIDLFKELVSSEPQWQEVGSKVLAADVGTGSGALGITAALEVPNCTVDLLELSDEAAKIAKINVDKFTISLSVIISDLLAGAPNDYDVLLCNLPYVPDEYPINEAAAFEPKIALFGGKDGLDLYKRLFGQIGNSPKQPLYLLIESLPAQHGELDKIAAQAGYKLHKTKDFIQLFKRAHIDQS